MKKIVMQAVVLAAAMSPLAVYAETSTAEQRIARLEAELHKLRIEVSNAPKAESFEKKAVSAASKFEKKPYDWTGVTVGVYGGAFGETSSTHLTFPTTLGDNEVGFVPSSQYDSSTLYSSNYNNLAAPGSLSSNYLSTNAGSWTCDNSGNGSCYGNNTTAVAGALTPNDNAGSRTDTSIKTRDRKHNLVGVLGAELGYNHQFGSLVVGIGTDGTWFSGSSKTTTTSQGQFSNSRGYQAVANATGCNQDSYNGTGYGYDYTCYDTTNLNSYGNVTVNNSGSATSSQFISAGPSWLGTLRGTVGYAQDRMLVFGTAGLAYAMSDIKVRGTYDDTTTTSCSGLSSSDNGYISGSTSVTYSCIGSGAGSVSQNTSTTTTTNASWTGNKSSWMLGFAGGGGFAYAAADNLIVKVEGVYYNVGTIKTHVNGTGTQSATGTVPMSPTSIAVAGYDVTRQISGVIAKVGVSYKFD